MKRTNKTLTRMSLLAGLALLFGLAAGCYVEVEDDPGGVYLADLEVKWRVQGSQSVTYCDAYDISRWVIKVRGPESRDVVVDCRAHWWTSENDLLAMSEGHYTVTVEAEDSAGYLLTGQSSTIDLIDSGYVDVLTFQFYPSDFGF